MQLPRKPSKLPKGVPVPFKDYICQHGKGRERGEPNHEDEDMESFTRDFEDGTRNQANAQRNGSHGFGKQ